MSIHVTTKIWRNTRSLFRKIAAQTGETQVQVMDRLAEKEWAEVKDIGGDGHKQLTG